MWDQDPDDFCRQNNFIKWINKNGRKKIERKKIEEVKWRKQNNPPE